MTEFSLEELSAPTGLAGNWTGMFAEGEFNGWHGIKSRLTEFAQSPNAYQLLESVFEIQDHNAARTTLNEWREGVFSHLPKVSVLTDVEMQGALGGYSSALNTIFLSHSVNRYDLITGQVLLEEYGHYLDSRFNPSSDTAGDEGELFSAVVLKKNLTEQSLHRIGSEDDATHILLSSGERYRIEASSQVTLYEHAEYKGAAKSFGIGSHAYVGNDFNDRATSIAIPSGSGLVAEVFEHANFQGRSTVISYSQMSIGADWSDNNFKVSHMNDQTSSIIVRQRRSDEVLFFQHGNFQGLAHSDIVGSKSQARFNDDYSSIDLPDGVGIEVFEHPSFTGRSQVFTSDVSFIGLLNDQVSSYRTFPLASSYRVDRLNSDGNEGHRHTFKIFRTGNTAVAGQVRFSTSSDSAASDVDFSSYSAVRNFAPGQTEDVVYVDSRTDNVNEGTERFNVSISKINNADTITTASTFGQIFNVTPASSYRVDRLNSDGNEGHRHTFKIFRTGNTAVAGQVRFSTSSDSATSDVDFSSYSAVRNFAPGQTEDVVYVDSRTDKIGEATERFNVSISKLNTADSITVASTFGQIFNVNPPSGTTYVTPMGKTLAAKDAYVSFQRVDGPGFIEDKETWLIFHGWNGKSDDFAELGRAIEQYDGIRGGGDYQVVLVDWNAARNEGLANASLMIDSVAQAVKNTLTLWGIQSSKINLAGHSLGAYVSYELSKRLGSVNKLVAMNPASITLGGYNVGDVHFKRYSNWSWAFWQNNLTDSGSATLTADESFIISLPWYNPGSSNPDAGHGSAKLVWTNWLRNKNGALSEWFGLEDIRPRSAPWNIGWGWEAEIEANSSFIATGKYWEA
jgi:pimeloyl-ACP methyl ester carboxylesterase